MDWTNLIIAVFGAVGGVGIWQFLIVRARLDSKERMALSSEWQQMNDRLQAAEQRWRNEMEREHDKVIDLENRISRLINKNAELQAEIGKLAMENGSLQRENTKLSERVRELEKRMGTGPLKNPGV